MRHVYSAAPIVCSRAEDLPTQIRQVSSGRRSKRSRSLAMPVDVADLTHCAASEVQSLTIMRLTPKDAVGHTCTTALRWNDARQRNAMTIHYEDGNERGVAYEQVALHINGQTIRTCDTERGD